MTRNQKIALGCGGAGCLGLILLIVIAVVLSAAGYLSMPGTNSNYNSNSNASRNSNSNSSDNSNSDTGSSSTSSSITSDDKHKLYQAAGMTKDTAVMQRVIVKLGLADGDAHEDFVKQHFAWAIKNYEFIQSINTPEKARSYVDAHIDD